MGFFSFSTLHNTDITFFGCFFTISITYNLMKWEAKLTIEQVHCTVTRVLLVRSYFNVQISMLLVK